MSLTRTSIKTAKQIKQSEAEPSSQEKEAERISLFGIDIDVIDMRGSVDRIISWLADDKRDCKFVVTPNVDHVVMLQKNEQLKQAYDDASLVVADGFPVIVASKLLGSPLPERVAGSELVPHLFDRLQAQTKPTKVYLPVSYTHLTLPTKA